MGQSEAVKGRTDKIMAKRINNEEYPMQRQWQRMRWTNVPLINDEMIMSK